MAEKNIKLNPAQERLINRIIDSLGQEKVPWRKRWRDVKSALPMNAVTQKPYSKNNALLLFLQGNMEGFTDPRWCTFNQAKSQGWKVKKGSSASYIYHVRLYDKKTKQDFDLETVKNMTKEERQQYYQDYVSRSNKTFAVFNAEQLEGIPKLEQTETKDSFNNQFAAKFSDKVIDGIGLSQLITGNVAGYSLEKDFIVMPDKSSFINERSYYGTLFHELTHATGSKERLNRLTKENETFGSLAYAEEELVAELSSAMINIELGFDYENDNYSVSYCQSWANRLKNDKTLFYRALHSANKAKEYLYDKGNFKEIQQQYEGVKERESLTLNELKEKVSILDYGREILGFDFVKKSRNNYIVTQHDSCVINASQNDFYRYSRSVGGSIIDFIAHFEEVDTKTAINKLKNFYYKNGASEIEVTKSKSSNLRDIELPEKNITNKNVFAYLTKTRMISEEIVNEYIKEGILYQDDRNNCVFVGYIDNKVMYAMKRSSNPNSDYKGDVAGSFKEVGVYKENNADKLILTESVIDQMSLQTIKSEKANYLSVNGVANAIGALNFHMKKRDVENLKSIEIAFDNDQPGREAATVLEQYISENYPEIEVTQSFSNEKDWNEELIAGFQSNAVNEEELIMVAE